MPDLNISIPHQLSQDEALRRLKSSIADAKKQYGDKIDELRETWNGNSGTLNVAVMGQKLAVVLTVNPSDVNVQSALPMIAMMFRGKIEAAIRQEGTKLLA
jgi:Putative polyhydroxyalkanoic acid system protein (PHA_gran_rgn)